MSVTETHFDWADLVFADKKPISKLAATFMSAPREISESRFKQLIKQYLPKGAIVLGLAKESYVDGFENQPQFRMLQLESIKSIIDKVNAVSKTSKIYTLRYAQKDSKYLYEKLNFARVVLINGSWKYSFHTQAPYYTLVRHAIPYEMVSPFTDEAEAKVFAADTMNAIEKIHPFTPGVYTDRKMMQLASEAASYSFDNSFQTGASLGRPDGKDFELLAWSYNRVVPFQAYAMHYGASREKNFSPPNDLNHYDTVHAEVEMIIKAGKEHIDLRGTTLFINLLPCPSCARMFAETDIAEFVYSEDHSAGYAIKMLEAAGKTVRRLVL